MGNHSVSLSFVFGSCFLNPGSHHGFPVFLSHLEAFLSLFISLEEEITEESHKGKDRSIYTRSPQTQNDKCPLLPLRREE